MKVTRLLTLAAALTVATGGTAAANGPDVGHRVKHLVVPSPIEGEPPRTVPVHLWYPATGLSHNAPRTVYTSTLYGKDLAGVSDPLGWSVRSERAREGGTPRKNLDVIVFSHGSTNDPIDYAGTLEDIAAKGFLVAAPAHVNNTQDDVRIDHFITDLAGPDLFRCADGRVPPCAAGYGVPRSMRDRVRDISHTLDALEDWYGADTSQVGVMGHSRGTVTALAAAGGSATWGVQPEGRVRAIFGMAIGAAAVTNAADLENVTVPTVLAGGGRDRNSVLQVSRDAFADLKSADKLLVELPDATHRSFDSDYCAQLRSAAERAAGNPDAKLDWHTIRLIGASAPGGLSGKAVHYCHARYFTPAVDAVLRATANSEYPPQVAGDCAVTSLPCTGLDSDTVTDGMADIAATFFKAALGPGHAPYPPALRPSMLTRRYDMIGAVQAAGAFCKPQPKECPED